MFETGALYATTNYSYDARGNLKQVNQSTQTPRTFSYDGLSRLTTATNPESGSVSYTYDENSNLKTKLDARGITTQYDYDELNRVKLRNYSDTTPDVTYTYDPPIPNGKGRLASVTSSVSGYNYTQYDALGRVTAYNQQTAGQLYLMGATYNKGGLMVTESYPSGKVIETQYDSAGRIAGVKKQSLSTFIAGGVSGDVIQYTASGAVKAMKLGNGLWEHTNFNSRLQPTQIGLGVSSTTSERLQLDYGYGASASLNNGNITSQTITAPGFSVTQSYSYDQVNRLASATETAASVQTWQQVYGYDVYGNRWVNASSYIPTPALTPQSQSAFNAANNRLVSGLGYNYDLVGNVTKDPTTALNAMVYDAENRQVSYTKASVTTSYTYDGDGRRVKKIDSAGTTVFVYNAGGQLIAEYVENGGGGTVQMSYLSVDHLGSTRVVTDGNQAVKARHDYLPFGEELGSGIGGRTTAMGYSQPDGIRQKFTSKERDTESGLDYFLARYYSGAQGRFTSVDPLQGSGESEHPQSWNRYVYTFNNPLRYIDPTGEFSVPIAGISAIAGEMQQRQQQQAPPAPFNITVTQTPPKVLNNESITFTGPDKKQYQHAVPGPDGKPVPGGKVTGIASTLIIQVTDKDGKPVQPSSGFTIEETVNRKESVGAQEINRSTEGKKFELREGGWQADVQAAVSTNPEVFKNLPDSYKSESAITFTLKNDFGASVTLITVKSTVTKTDIKVEVGKVVDLTGRK